MHKSPGHRELLAALGEIRSYLEEQPTSLQDGLDHAVEVMRENTKEVGFLRDAIEDFRELYEWALNNSRQDAPAPFHLTSMPLDPLTVDWAARLNRANGDQPEHIASHPTSLTSEHFHHTDEPFRLQPEAGATQRQQRLF